MFKLAAATAVMANQLPTDLAALQGADIPKLQAQIRRRLQGEFGNSTGNGNDQTQLTPALTATWQEKCRYICKDANVFSRGVCYVVCSFLLVDDGANHHRGRRRSGGTLSNPPAHHQPPPRKA